MLRSLRVTLTFWYVSVLAIVLFCFGAALYVMVASNLRQDVDERLVLQADATAESIFAFWRAERAAPGAGPGNWHMAPSGTFLGDLTRGELPSLLSRWAARTGSLDTDRLIRFLDPDGTPLGASKGFAQLHLPVSASAQQVLHAGRAAAYRTLRLPDRHLRLLTRPINMQGQPLYGVQLAADLREIDESLGRLWLWLIVLVPVTLLIVAILSLARTTTILNPIRPLILKAQQFVAEQLHQSPNVLPAQDDLQQLTLTINDLLSRLEQTLRRLRQFTAAASHELRTPLTIMMGEIGLALRKPREPEEYQRVLHAHLQAVNELAHTVEALLELSQSEAATGETGWTVVELGALARRQGTLLRPLAKQREVELALPANGTAWVYGDTRLLERLVANLLDNAIKHIPPKGRVTIHTNRQGEDVCLTVADTGPGIPKEDWPKLFNRFFVPRTASDAAHPVSGLGLNLCRWIAEAHHGGLELANIPGGGFAVTVRLHACPAPAVSRT